MPKPGFEAEVAVLDEPALELPLLDGVPVVLDVEVDIFGSWPKPGFEGEVEDLGSCPNTKSGAEFSDFVD